ncbi:MAG: MFS transporter, partial [candidate division Zixibacteria bacterium]|nr:MFS transporter [candidate division Zixibacteria bacterium]
GSFALAENYLFTTEAFQDYWLALSDSGYMMMEHQFYMPRLVSEVIDALEDLGVEDARSHFAVYDLPQLRRNALLLSKRPLTDSLRYYALDDLTQENYEYVHLLYPASDSLENNLINRIVQNGWQNEADSERIDISPCTDNKPFIAQMGLWENFSFDNLERVLPYEFMGFPLSKVIFIIILIIVFVIVLPLNLIPYFTKGEKLKLAPWLYFFLIGMAYMAVEVILIQKYTLFVGPSVYSIAVILITLLVSSGIGSRFSKKVSNPFVFLAIIVWLLLDIFAFGYLTRALSGLTMYPRIFITMILFFPLGFFMGMPFPKGTLRVGQLIDWGFAVNGAASVFGSTLILLVAFAFGFNMALIVAAGLYLLAFALLSAKNSW